MKAQNREQRIRKYTTYIASEGTDTREEAVRMTDDLMAVLRPVVEGAGLELFDVELRSGVLLVTVDRAGGVDLAALTEANRVVSAVLDERDPIPGRYTLEVSSPGVERTLRTPAHFAKAIGETVSVKTRPQVPGERRVRGRLVVSDDHGFEIAEDGSSEPRRLAYADVDRVRTVFAWGPEPRRSGTPGPGRGPDPARKATEKKRKQVVTP
jgi:ribosome maturation factor RimP